MDHPKNLTQLLAAHEPAPVPVLPDVAFVQLYQEDTAAIRAEIAAGLTQPRPVIAPKYFYDALGSRLFEAITELPEYYPTRTEASIFAQHGQAIAKALGPGTTLIDLGAGNCEKAARLFDLLSPAQYVAVDISVEFLRHRLQCLQREHRHIDMLGVGMDFSQELALPAQVRKQNRVLFYPGSSIGNFAPQDALRLLKHMARAAGPGGKLLIGMDLVKPQAVLVPAYDDALGVTAAFNLNVLPHVNRLLGSDFAVADWQHVALFNTEHSRIEMHLEAKRDVHVRWPGGSRSFTAGQRIHTENSHKYTQHAAAALLADGGFAVEHMFTDPAAQFAVFLARVV
jgi:L-histidine Nalpha-methyltransferase